MLERFIRNNKGSISVLLSIILLPTLLFSGVLIDISNRQMSKAMVESAGELAMSSALSQYDTVLEDVYGLFAMSQNYDDLKDNVAQYMKDTLDASGLLEGTDYGSHLINAAVDLIDAEVGEIDPNFIQAKLELDDETGGLASSSLSHPQVMKNQIVEFMKYRGIQVAAQDLLSVFKQFSSLDEKTTVASQKMEVADKQEKLSDAAQAFYEAIVQMDKNVKKVEEQYDAAKNIWGPSQALFVNPYNGQLFIAQYYNGETVFGHLWSANYNLICAADEVELPEKAFYYIDNVIEIDFTIPDDTNQIPIFCVRDKMHTEDGNDKVISTKPEKDFEEAKKKLAKILVELNRTKEPLLDTGTGYFELDSQGGIRPNKAAYDAYVEFIEYVVDYTSQLRYMKDLVVEYEKKTDPLTEEEQQEHDQWKDVLKGYANSLQNILAQHDRVTTDNYELWTYVHSGLGGYHSYADMAEDYVKKMEQYKTKAGEHFAKAFNFISPYYNAVEEALNAKANNNWYEKLFNSGDNYFDYVVKLGEKVKENVRELKKSNNTYGQTIKTYENQNGTDDFSAQMSSDQKSNDEIFTEADVDEVLVQIKAVKKFLEGERDRLKNGKIYGASIDFSKTYGAGDYSSLGKKYLKAAKSTIREYTATYPTANYVDVCNGTFITNITVKCYNTDYKEDSYTKQVKELRVIEINGKTVSIPVPEFYLYLAQTYDYGDKTATDSEEDNMNNAASSKEGEADQKADTGKVNGSSGAFDGVHTNKFEAETYNKPDGGGSGRSRLLKQFQAFGNLFNGIIKLCKNITKPENIRDDLLVTTYIFEEFSHYMDTKDVQGGDKAGTRKTLTNQVINSKNNVLYGCEIEYILYGDYNDPKSNIDTVKGNIFAIRFVSNCIFAICDGSINAWTLSPALAIQAATLGIFPYKVAQIILDIVLALCESVYDVSEIMDGKKIPLFKSTETWIMSPTGAANLIKNKAIELATENINKLGNKLQEIVNNKVGKLADKVNSIAGDVTDSVTTTLRGYMDQAIGTLSQIISSELTGLINKVYTGKMTGTLSTEEISSGLKSALNNYITSAKADGTLSEQVGDFLAGHVDGLVNAVMTTKADIGGTKLSVTDILNKVTSEYNELITTGQNDTIEVNATYFENLMKAVSASIVGTEDDPNSGYLGKIKNEIDTKVQEWTSELSTQITGKINGYIDQGMEELNAKAAEEISKTVDGAVGKLFPQEAKMDFNPEGSASGGTLGDMFNFGYIDYLRLFLFLGVCSNKQSAILTRIGDVITINRVKGLKDYYTGQTAPSGQTTDGSGNVTDDGYSMYSAYTYMVIKAKVTVKPMILGSAWFSSDGAALQKASNVITSGNFWSYEYATTGGY